MNFKLFDACVHVSLDGRAKGKVTGVCICIYVNDAIGDMHGIVVCRHLFIVGTFHEFYGV